MTNIDKLSYITNLLFNKIEDTEIDLTEEECDNIVNFSKDIRKGLRKSEKLESEIQTRIDTLQKRQEYLYGCLGSMECFIEYNFNRKKLELLFELKEMLKK